jgi:hypothetical protein
LYEGISRVLIYTLHCVASMKRPLIVVILALLAGVTGNRPAAGQSSSAKAPPPTASAERALLNQYCVTCHSDELKTANLSLEKLDLSAVGDHAEVWEKVIRKLRAGMMPPPGMPRPPLAKYEELRDWLEAQVDRTAAAHPNPGSVVLHRLNRTEYANAIRDLLDLDINASTLLPADDAARGFDNVAGSLTISPTLLEAYTTAATRIARTAVGFWKSPTEAAYIAPGDTSQTQHLDGLPFGSSPQFSFRWRIQVFSAELRTRQIHSRREARVSYR